VRIGFLTGAVALLGFGIYLLGDSLLKLIEAKHPTIQTIGWFGTREWLGWLMIAALTYSVIPPFVLGRMKLPLARELHDKVLQVSATLDKGDWLAGLAGLFGILGIAYGLWWADGAAAAFISVEIIKDGWENLKNAVEQLMNKRPSDVETKEHDPVVDKLQEALQKLEWVQEARVRLREQGDILTGEAFLQVRDDHDLLARLEQARDIAGSIGWRMHDAQAIPVRTLV
jgi:divalent metal cation (Fe/Co/Zn/Cd) transporter